MCENILYVKTYGRWVCSTQFSLKKTLHLGVLFQLTSVSEIRRYILLSHGHASTLLSLCRLSWKYSDFAQSFHISDFIGLAFYGFQQVLIVRQSVVKNPLSATRKVNTLNTSMVTLYRPLMSGKFAKSTLRQKQTGYLADYGRLFWSVNFVVFVYPTFCCLVSV